MFTGIIQSQGYIEAIRLNGQTQALMINCQYDDLDLGESVAVDGVCLTVTRVNEYGFECDVSPETLAKTIAKTYREGSTVNLERALRVGDRLSGHWVQGHVDGTLRLASRRSQDGFETLILVGFTEEEASYLIPKGSIAINGVSLTLNSVTEDAIALMLIPETLKRTGLASLKVGDLVNVEYDYLAKVAVRQHALREKTYE